MNAIDTDAFKQSCASLGLTFCNVLQHDSGHGLCNLHGCTRTPASLIHCQFVGNLPHQPIQTTPPVVSSAASASSASSAASAAADDDFQWPSLNQRASASAVERGERLSTSLVLFSCGYPFAPSTL
eukprot:m.63720 g.63720  ORF g.63720 m.63720 type:complete len:126 (+) comp49668_c0_seq2:183-560(+)